MSRPYRPSEPPRLLLGEVTEFRGGQVAELGQWLVVFRRNTPIALRTTGTKVRRLIDAPLIGAGIATLDTTPQDMLVEIRDCPTSDGYRVADLTVRLQIRLTPEVPNASEELLARIRLHGHRFFDSIASDIRRRVDDIVRTMILRTTATDILNRGPMKAILPGTLRALHDCSYAEITTVTQIDWTEAEFARDVRQTIERDVADRSKENYLRDARERDARARDHQQLLDAGHQFAQQRTAAALQSMELDSSLQRALALGIDPLAVAEPALWEAMTRQHNDVILKLLDSPQLYPLMRSNPDLMRAVLRRLTGDSSPLPMGRQADMVLDGIDPQRTQQLAGARVHPASTSIDFLHKAGLIVNSQLNEAWQSASGTPKLLGAAYTVAPSQSSCLVLLVSTPVPDVPADFTDKFVRLLAEQGTRVGKVGVYTIEGRYLDEVIAASVQRIDSEVTVELNLRQTSDRREVFVQLGGPPHSVQTVYERMTDPTNPILPTLEGLIDNRAMIRFSIPGA